MKDPHVDLVKSLLSVLPEKFSDRYLDLVYRHGYLIGLLSELAKRDKQIRRELETRIKLLKINQ
jgi:hypothetical protein